MDYWKLYVLIGTINYIVILGGVYFAVNNEKFMGRLSKEHHQEVVSTVDKFVVEWKNMKTSEKVTTVVAAILTFPYIWFRLGKIFIFGEEV